MDDSPPVPDFSPEPRSSTRGYFRYVLAGACASLLAVVGFMLPSPDTGGEPPLNLVDQPEPQQLLPTPTPVPSGDLYTSPTPQRLWRQVDNPAVYMPTGSGRVASAGYGSVRTGSNGLPRFHEGIDVSPMERDRRQRALDPIFSMGDGHVVHISRSAGNSSYGIYIVIEHEDEVGKVYTLYSHLASVAEGLQKGQHVTRGQPIGIMGYTSTLGIPVSRSHLHLEIGTILNGYYARMSKAQKRSNPHGNYHGFNLAGFDPRTLLFRLDDQDPTYFSFLEALQEESPAWRLLVKGSRRPNYFDRYPALWSDSPASGTAYWIEVSHGGVPLAGGFVSAEDAQKLNGGRYAVMDVDEKVLGRNARRHVRKRNGKWTLATNGVKWLEILTYRP